MRCLAAKVHGRYGLQAINVSLCFAPRNQDPAENATFRSFSFCHVVTFRLNNFSCYSTHWPCGRTGKCLLVLCIKLKLEIGS
jgi:hypothetical protein